jgi:plasmid rolling circle replication initiator protein Rep
MFSGISSGPACIVREQAWLVKPDSGAVAEPEYLTDYSERDRPWDIHRGQADEVAAIFGAEESLVRLSERMRECSEVLGFGWMPEREDPEVLSLKLREAHFCRVRLCPICQWRRSLMWVARFLKALPSVMESHPKARFLFLTLTQKNVSIENLRVALGTMNKAWDRLAKRAQFKIVDGWVRATEITRSEDDSAHPHFHVLLMVPPGYFKTPNYINQVEWTRLWRESLRVEYDPIVHIQAVKGDVVVEAVRETFKYAVKPGQMKWESADWVRELHRQLRGLRFMATGGVFKGVLREGEETEQDLMLFGEDGAEVGGDDPKLYFKWSRPVKRYRRRRVAEA